MTKPTALIVSGYGINCEEETEYAFRLAGAETKIVHINDLIEAPEKLNIYQILVIPGGFSFGDDLGAGRALANRMRSHLWEPITHFIDEDHLVLGICNGFQVLVALGLLPALYNSYGLAQVALVANDIARYTDRWVDLEIASKSPWLRGIKTLSLPVAHGEGKFYASEETLTQLQKKDLIALRYVEGEICSHFELNANPNGSMLDIAGITDEGGRVLGLMPHPERAITFTQLPHWPYLKEKLRRELKPVPKKASGMRIFRNAVTYFENL